MKDICKEFSYTRNLKFLKILMKMAYSEINILNLGLSFKFKHTPSFA